MIERHAKQIDKIVDLLSRIKNTDQAEEVMTVLFASRELKKTKPGEHVTEKKSSSITFWIGRNGGGQKRNSVR